MIYFIAGLLAYPVIAGVLWLVFDKEEDPDRGARLAVLGEHFSQNK